MCFNDWPRACALGFEEVSPLQGFSLSIDVSTMILRRKVGRICPMQGFLRTNLTAYMLDFLGDAGMSAFRHDTFS